MDSTDLRNALTPIENHGEHWVKRDDTFDVFGQRGGKVRTCLSLAERGIGNGMGGLVTAGSRHSPQVAIVAAIAQRLGVPCRVHVPTGEITPETEFAKVCGAEVIRHTPGYNTVIKSRATLDAAESGWVDIPFGMETQEAVEQTAGQVSNVNVLAKAGVINRVVVPVGSGMSLCGVMEGLYRCGSRLDVLGIVVGANPIKRLNRYGGWDWRFNGLLEMRMAGTGKRMDLEVGATNPSYGSPPETSWLGDLELDHVYEAKCIPFLEADDLLWVVGKRAS